METLEVDLPDSMKRLAEGRAAEAGFGSVGEYVQELIRSDLQRRREERLEALLIEGLDSGPPIPVTPEFWEERKRRLLEEFGQANPPR
jgi:antitoxin ParD1/3/4